MKLICPICQEPLEKINASAVCVHHHTFDYAKQGYLNLLITQSKDHGDNPEMVKARTGFLNTGAYQFLRDALSQSVQKEKIQVLADLGCGEGYYTSALPCKEKYGFDLSKDALKHASKNDPASHYTVASIFHLPLPDACCDAAVTCFAPAACEEIARILKPNGCFLFVTPGPRHLFEMKSVLYDTPYENEMEDLAIDLRLEKDVMIEQKFVCSQEGLMNLFLMTPYAYRTSLAGRDKLAQAGDLELTAQFRIRTYRR
jgi:23S rRNA (guanine745-N1)-methyltransferase